MECYKAILLVTEFCDICIHANSGSTFLKLLKVVDTKTYVRYKNK